MKFTKITLCYKLDYMESLMLYYSKLSIQCMA